MLPFQISSMKCYISAHHQIKAEKERQAELERQQALEAEAAEAAARMQQQQQQSAAQMYPSPRGNPYLSPRGSRGRGVRHEPYAVPSQGRGQRRLSGAGSGTSVSGSAVVKSEPFDSSVQSDSENSNSGLNEAGQYQGQDTAGGDNGSSDGVSVKMESLEDDLEITGVELGQSVPADPTWDPNAGMAMSFDPSTGAPGSSQDTGGYSKSCVLFPLQSGMEKPRESLVFLCL